VSDEPFIREERRLVTLVFADVVGSTALAEELDAEDVRALLSRYYAIAHEVVEAHGGAVAKLLGDGVLAVFGVPMAHGDDAQRTLDASLALRGRVMREEALARLQLRIGINTGEVVATQDARGEIVGDAVNVAARVAAAAEPDQILAADATHRAARSFEYGDLREIVAKGKSQPVRTWPVLRREAERATGAPFIGREDDLAQLELTARRAFRDRRPHLVTITAPTGVGKSRLVAEFRQRLPVDSWHAHTHCPPYGATAFAPLRELLVELLGLSADAPADDIRRHVGAVLEEVEAPRDGVLIAATVAPDAKTDEQDRDRIFAAWRRLLERLATERPMLLVLEDLQWASDSLLDLIEHVVQLASPVPLLVVCLARPELLQRRPTWGGGRRNTINFALEPLGADDVARLVTSLLEAEPPRRLRDLIVERADGNPYFAEELVRALLERGLDLKDPVAVDTALRALPETVQATVLARIDMLAPDERAVLQSGAVVGRSFDAQTLRVICQIDASGISAALERLVGRDLLTKSGEGAYAFGNALIREVAYGMLPRARRARDHAIVAQRLQTTAGERIEEFAALIGFHYLEATRLRRASAISIAIEGADEETTRAGAIIWLARSARANTTAGAWTEALAQLQDALGLATGDERIPLLVQLGETTAGGDVGWDALTEALRTWRASPDGDPAVGARIIVDMLIMQFRSGVSISPDRHPDEAALERLAAEALDLANRCGDELVQAAALVTHAYLERSREGRTAVSLRSARAEAERAAGILERHRDWQLWSIAIDAWAAIVGDLGDLRGGHDIAMLRIGRIDQLSTIERAHANWTMPLYKLALGDVDGAREHVLRALAEPVFTELREGSAALVGLVFMLSWRAATHWLLGRWDDVLNDAREALEATLRMVDDPTRSVYSHTGTAALYVARRRGREDLVLDLGPVLRRWVTDERARALLDDDPRHLEGALDRVMTAGIDTWQVERSVSLLAAYRVAIAPERLDRLVADAETRGLRPLVAQLLRLRGRARSDAGDLRRAHALLTQMSMHADAALAAVELATLTRDAGLLDHAEAELSAIGDQRGLALAAEARAAG